MPKKSEKIPAKTYKEILAAVKTIEDLLVTNYKAEGRGLHEKVSSVQLQLPALAVRGLRVIGTVRNKVIHDPDFPKSEIPEDFNCLASEVIEVLSKKKKRQGKTQPKPSGKSKTPGQK